MTGAILQTDQTLTEKEKESEVEHLKAEAMMATAKIQQEMQHKVEQLLQQKVKSNEDHMKELSVKMEELKQSRDQLEEKRPRTWN